MGRYERLPKEDQRKQLILADDTTRLKTRLGWRHQTSARMANIDIKREETTPHFPPWRQFENLIVDRVPLDKPKEEYTEEELYSISIQKIQSIPSEIRIFTDGSTGGMQKNGGPGIHIEDTNTGRIIHQAKFPAGKYCSSYTGECVALLEAVKWLAEHPHISLICTDSLSVQSALEQNDWKDRDPWLKQIKESIYHGSSQIVLPMDTLSLWD